MRVPQAVFLDFDGVVLESLDIKSEAMAELFADHPEHVKEIVRFHVENAGVNRYEKFRHYYANLFVKPLSDQEMARLDKAFGELIWGRMLTVPFVPGAREFIERWSARLPLFVISAAPQGEVDRIVEQRGLKSFFQTVHGSPTNKKEHLGRILAERKLDPTACVFVGDGKADFEAAAAFGMPFVQRLTRHAPAPFGPCAGAVDDLRGLEALWAGNGGALRLCASAANAGAAARKAGGGAWAYFGRDYRAMKRWERALGPAFSRLDTGEGMQRSAKTLRRPYLDWLAGLGRELSSPSWWTSEIAEENTLTGGLFNDVCALDTARRLLDAAAPILIVADNPALLDCLKLLRPASSRIEAFPKLGARLRFYTLFARRWTAFFLRGLGSLAAARATRRGETLPKTGGKPVALLHTCIESSYFGADGPRDAYFSVLPAELRRRGYAVVTLPWLYNPGRSLREAFAWFRSRPGEFLIAEDFYNPLDLLRAARTIVSQRKLPPLPQKIGELDVTPLVAQARLRQSVNASAAPFALHRVLFERLAARGFKPSLFIDSFEGSLTEKTSLMAIRRFMPGTETVGYQHISAPPLTFLQQFTGAGALETLPDVVVCNSAFTRELLAREGFPPQRLRLGASLRHLPLLQPPPPREAQAKTILVGLPLDDQAACEVMGLLLEAFPVPEGLTFWIKPHPNMPKAQLRSVLGDAALPSHMPLAPEGSLARLSARAACAVVGASTAALELALSGVPVVSVGRAAAVDFNPLAYFQEHPAPARSAPDLRAAVQRACALSAAESRVLAEWAQRAKAELLCAPSEETLDPFTSSNGHHAPCTA